MRAFVHICLFLAMVLVLEENLGDAPYAVLLAMGAAVAVFLLVPGRVTGRAPHVPRRSAPPVGTWDAPMVRPLAWLWLPVLLSWLIGVLVGLLNGVNPQHVFRNFFGLIVFGMFPLLVAMRLRPSAVIDTVLCAGFVQMAYAIVLFFSFELDPAVLLFASSISDLRAIYSLGFVVIFPVFALGVAQLLGPPNTLGPAPSRAQRVARHPLITLSAFFALVVPAMSKGFILATLVLAFVVGVFSLVYWRRARRFPTPIVLALVLVAAGIAMLPREVMEFVLASYGGEEMGNALRSEQAGHLIADFSFLGRGLGATLPSGYARDDTGYGFELTYLNLIHKLGAFSFFLFAIYSLTLAVALLRLWRGARPAESVFVLGCLGYLVVGAGNPLLLAPTAVVLQCLAMYVALAPYLATAGLRPRRSVEPLPSWGALR